MTSHANATGARTTGRLRVDGADIHYEVCGRGPAIVFAHGLGGSHISWWQQVAHFSAHHTCLTFSHRGFAPSLVDAGPIDPVRYADDLRAVLDHLAIERAHLVGQSMGGWTVVEFALRHPQRVRSIVLSATTGSIDPACLKGFDHAALTRWKQEAGLAATQCRAVAVHPAAGQRMAREQPALHQLYQHIDELSRGLDKEALRVRLQAMRVRAPDDLAVTKLPVLLVSPGEDIVIAPLTLRSLAAAIPGARLVTIEQTGHSPYFERAPAFNRCLDDFFQSIHRESEHVAAGA
jgi:3-oxoadipate enol-lactonase